MELLEKLRTAVRELRAERAPKSEMQAEMQAGMVAVPAPGLELEDLQAMVRSAARRARDEGAGEAWEEASRLHAVQRRHGEQEAETRGVLAGLRTAVDLIEATRAREINTVTGVDDPWRSGGAADNVLVALMEPLNDAIASVAEKGMHGEREGRSGTMDPFAAGEVGVYLAKHR